jgi:hypothetical protein
MFTKATARILDMLSDTDYVSAISIKSTNKAMMALYKKGYVFKRERRRLTEASAVRPPLLWARSPLGKTELERFKRIHMLKS